MNKANTKSKIHFPRALAHCAKRQHHHPKTSSSNPLGFDMRGPEFTERRTPASNYSSSKSSAVSKKSSGFSTKMSYHRLNTITTVLFILVLALFISEINSRSSFNCGLTCYR